MKKTKLLYRKYKLEDKNALISIIILSTITIVWIIVYGLCFKYNITEQSKWYKYSIILEWVMPSMLVTIFSFTIFSFIPSYKKNKAISDSIFIVFRIYNPEGNFKILNYGLFEILKTMKSTLSIFLSDIEGKTKINKKHFKKLYSEKYTFEDFKAEVDNTNITPNNFEFTTNLKNEIASIENAAALLLEHDTGISELSLRYVIINILDEANRLRHKLFADVQEFVITEDLNNRDLNLLKLDYTLYNIYTLYRILYKWINFYNSWI